MLVSRNINILLQKTLNKILKEGITCSPRNLETKELLNHTVVLTNPRNYLATFPSRGNIIKYLCGELLWYFSGSLNVNDIAKYSKFWLNLQNKNGTVNSNYGYFVFYQKLKKYNNKSQFDWCVNELLKNKDSRAAVINFNQPCHKYLNNKDMVCTMYVSFLIRNNKLHCFTYLRSHDVIFGSFYDIPFFAILQQILWLELKNKKYKNLELGYLYHTATSFHLYSNKYEMAKKLITDKLPVYKNILPMLDYIFVKDIKNKTNNSKLMQFLYKNVSGGD